MAQQSFTPSQREAFRRFIAKHLPNAPSASPTPTSTPSLCSGRIHDSNEYDMYIDVDDASDEGFGEEWPPFSPKEFMSFMTNEQATNFIKAWTDVLPTEYAADIHKHISPRLHKDFVRDLPHELKYQVLSYLDVEDLTRSMTVSVTWWEICSYPLLWKSLYFEEGWTVADEVIAVFEHRLYRLQQQLDFQYHRLRSAQYGMDEYRSGGSPRSDSGEIDSSRGSAQQHPPMSFEKSRLYDELFFELDLLLNGSKTHSALRDIQSQFSVIAGLEIGEPFSNSAMFIPNSNGTIRLHIDWRYLYANRSLLENNWRAGRYQARLLDGAPDVVPPAQREGVYCVYFDRKLLAAGSRDNSIRLWDMDNLTYRGSLKAHSGSVLCLQFDSQRNILISGSSDATIKIWNLESGEVVQTLEGHKESVLGLHTDDKYIVSCSRDCTARIWSCVEDSEEEDPSYVNAMDCADPRRKPIPKYVLLHVLKGHRAAVNSVHFIDDLIATASGDRTIRIWNLRKGLCIRTIHAHGRGIACVNIAGDLVVTGSSDHVIKIFNIANGLEVRTLRGHNGLVRTIQTDNTKIISGSYDQSIRIWDLKTGKMLQELGRCHDSKIFRVHRDQRRLISCCGNAKIVVWDFTRPPHTDDGAATGRNVGAIDATFF